MDQNYLDVLDAIQYIHIDSQLLYDRAIEYSSYTYEEVEYLSEDLEYALEEYESRFTRTEKLVIFMGFMGFCVFVGAGFMYLATKFNW